MDVNVVLELHRVKAYAQGWLLNLTIINLKDFSPPLTANVLVGAVGAVFGPVAPPGLGGSLTDDTMDPVAAACVGSWNYNNVRL